LLPALLDEGFRVEVLTRSPSRAAARLPSGVTPVGWDGVHAASEVLAGTQAVVHLAGEPIFGGAPTRRRRDRIRASRVESTRALVDALGRLPAEERPGTLVCASAVGIYGSRGDELLEESATPGSGFVAELCIEWEAEARAALEHGVRAVSLRIGIVLAREGGALAAMLRPFRMGCGGRLGSGRQWVPWIHADDLVGLVLFVLGQPSVAGPVNAVAPLPVRNAELTRALAAMLRRPALLPAPAWLLRMLLGELAEELLDSRRVVPRVAEQQGFFFRNPELAPALTAELGRTPR
jgi:uncharacterized protein (TIGR01777 family)